jgi:sucrose-6-phosphate hydrolase SacC (GH32 family)
MVDRTSLEVFGNDGRVSFTSFFVADPEFKELSLTAVGGTAKMVTLDVHELKSAWN